MRSAGEDTWEKFSEEISELEGFLSQSSAKIVRNPRIQIAARTLAHNYYREVRPHLAQLGIPAESFAPFEGPIGKLLKVSNLPSSRAIYKACIISTTASFIS